jgi:SAM-dependent methyltransferase
MNLDIIEANQRVHTALIISGEYQKSPHRRPESTRRVRSVLSSLHPSSNELMHLDIGCGDGFVFECTPENWASQGIDATPAMLAVCAKNHPNVKLTEGFAEALPFSDSSFDVLTCYSFLDHLESTDRFFSEAMRVLKPGGVFYFGLNPNRDFYASLLQSNFFELSDFLRKTVDVPLEVHKAFNDGMYYEENFGIDKKDLEQCEPGKSITHGLSCGEEHAKLKALGFGEIQIAYEWVLQQNRLDPDVIDTITKFLPFTSSCFKYFDLMGKK